MTLQEALIVAVLATWCFAAVLYQCLPVLPVRWALAVRRLDVFGWLVSFNLFTGRVRPLRLSYRDRRADGGYGEWRTVSLSVPHRWRRALFRPRSRALDLVASMADDLAALAASPELQRRPIVERFAYQGVGRYVMRLAGASPASGRQWRIDDESGVIDPIVCSGIEPHGTVRQS